MKVLITIPTYNEGDNIEALLRAIWKENQYLHILVVDDNSPDGTAKKVQVLQKAFPTQLHLLQRPQKEGLGRAYLAAFKWFLERKSYQVLVQMDADFSHRPQDLPLLLSPLENPQINADAVVGSRYISGGQVENWSLFRRALSQMGSLYSSLILSATLKDWTGGFNAWKREVLSKLDLQAMGSQGYVFQIELKGRALHRGFKVVEAPICFACRRAGVSKMSPFIVWEALFKVWQIRHKVFKATPAKAPIKGPVKASTEMPTQIPAQTLVDTPTETPAQTPTDSKETDPKESSRKFLSLFCFFVFVNLICLSFIPKKAPANPPGSQTLLSKQPLQRPHLSLKKSSKYQYGKISFPVVPVRKAPHPKSKILSQLTFGEIYFISKKSKNKFYKIQFHPKTFGYVSTENIQALGFKIPYPKKEDGIFKEKEFLFFESFAGLQWVQMNLSEKKEWGRSSASISFLGLKITAPDLFFEGPIFDMNLLVNLSTPPFYKQRTEEDARATFVLWDGLILVPLTASLDSTFFLGLGPAIKYSHVTWSKNQNYLQENDLQWGFTLNMGYSLRLWRNHCLKLEAKHISYWGPSLTYNGLGLGWQSLF